MFQNAQVQINLEVGEALKKLAYNKGREVLWLNHLVSKH